MARPEAVAIGGYYPTPDHLIPLIANRLKFEEGHNFKVSDPCAGDGSAIIDLLTHAKIENCSTLYACELETTRYEALQAKAQKTFGYAKSHLLQGDAFRITTSDSISTDLLYLNPPYDLDPVHGRLEEKFLVRFTPILEEGSGILLFLVPYYALKASAQTLATYYADLECWRFPQNDFGSYKQVLLIGRRIQASPFGANPEVSQKVEAWANDPESLPSLEDEVQSPIAVESSHRYWSGTEWKIQACDMVALLSKVKPWQQTSKTGFTTPVPHILPDLPIEDLMFRTFPVATAIRPAHIASGIASGLFNGRRVSSVNDRPDLLVKGVFDREYVTVEEKCNKDGDVTSLVQVQQPKLVTTVLDLETYQYSTLGTAGAMTIEELLEFYGPSLMRVMKLQCPVAYDPQRDSSKITLAPLKRKLYTAQANAAKALLTLLGGPNKTLNERRGKGATLLGEIGVGKSSVVLAVGQTIAKRMLVMCPPHLLTSWENEVKAVLPDAEFRILDSITDVEAIRDIPKDRFVVAVLSRETAKLGHGWESVRHSCPKCGSALPKGDLAKTRARCKESPRLISTYYERAAYRLAHTLAPFRPNDLSVHALLKGRFDQVRLKHYKASERTWEGLPTQHVKRLQKRLLETLAVEDSTSKATVFIHSLLADYNPDTIAKAIHKIGSTREYLGYTTLSLLQGMLLLLPIGGEAQQTAWEFIQRKTTYGWPSKGFFSTGSEFHTLFGDICWENGKVSLDGNAQDSVENALRILSLLVQLGSFSLGPVCDEPLFQAVPEPRRFPLAKYIAKRCSGMFDFFVADESHEYNSADSAQSHAAHRITSLRIPTVYMTGSVMNGYASSLFTNSWALSPEFRAEFSRDEQQRFIDRYGYRKRVISDKDYETKEIVKFGSQTDRVERSERTVGDAPGVLPLFLFRHLLANSVTLHKADLALDLPRLSQIQVKVTPSAEVKNSYDRLKASLIKQIKKDRRDEELSGKLFGALAELPSYLDRAILGTGNQDDGTYKICYPESVGKGVVAEGLSVSPLELLEKEIWMLDTLRSELTEGRNVLVLAWHTSLLPRLAHIIERELGIKVPVLYSDKVPTAKRQDWIDKTVLAKGAQVLVVNPVAIQTGLNNLVHFSTEIWMENPAVNPMIFRQTIGRVDRIGQRKETRIYVPVYEGTLQVQLNELLLRKVAVSVSTDGLDNESMLLAIGATGDGYLSGLSIGRQLWAMIESELAA